MYFKACGQSIPDAKLVAIFFFSSYAHKAFVCIVAVIMAICHPGTWTKVHSQTAQ